MLRCGLPSSCLAPSIATTWRSALSAHRGRPAARTTPGFAGLAQRDLRPQGGHEVEALSTLAMGSAEHPCVLVHVGGEILTCDAWQAAVMLLPPEQAQPAIAYLDTLAGEARLGARHARNRRDCALHRLARRDRPGLTRVIYDGVGDRPGPCRARAARRGPGQSPGGGRRQRQRRADARAPGRSRHRRAVDSGSRGHGGGTLRREDPQSGPHWPRSRRRGGVLAGNVPCRGAPARTSATTHR